MCSRAGAGLTLIALQDCMANTPLLNTISYRRDVVFSQAITATTSAFITKLSSSVTNEFAIKQFIQLGMLIQFESLITCYSDEMGMLEDMEVAMNDLVNVTFRVQKLPIGTHTEVILSGQRYSYSVIVQLCEDVFNALPLEAQEQHVFRIVPVMFSIGINEQASLAEKFGDISFQEAINRKNYDHLHGYYKNYVNFQQKHSKVDNQRTVQSLADLMHHLSACMLSKKSKNVDILHMAEEVCLAMNGARMTGCKSAKDRTAMAVTLEQVRLLQREHDMASDVFLHALECFRSEGVRRENTRKNTGTAKYAFNSLQLLSLPKLYRPPAGTYANVET
jgi:inositol polyphosphate-4-phosphatase